MKNSHIPTLHHKLCQSSGGNRQPGNVIMLRENIHRAVHTLFSDATPLQRIRRSLEVDKSTLDHEVYKQLDEVLKRFEGVLEYQIYKPELFNIDKFIAKNVS